MTDPFIVLHVCMGNICRSPMAERLLVQAIRDRGGDADLMVSASAGTGGWHHGERMNPPAARELARRGVDADDFRARKLLAAHIDVADLVLTATGEQLDFGLGLRPDAEERMFVLGEFGRLLREPGVAETALADWSSDPLAVPSRARSLVKAAHAARDGAGPTAADDLDDPWGRGAEFFTGTAGRIVTSLEPFARLLYGDVLPYGDGQ